MHDLTGFQRDILYVIAGLGEPKGVAIKDELDEYYPKEVPPGQLYSSLDTLADEGMIRKESHDRRTNAYELTEQDEREIEARQEWKAQYVSLEFE